MTISQVTVKIISVLWGTWNRDSSPWQRGWKMGLHSCSSGDTPHSTLLVRGKSFVKTHLSCVFSSLRARPSMKPAHTSWRENTEHTWESGLAAHSRSIGSAEKVSGLSEQLQKIWVSLCLEHIFRLCVRLCPLPGAKTERSFTVFTALVGGQLESFPTSHFFSLSCALN